MRFLYIILFLFISFHLTGQTSEKLFSNDSINVIGNATENTIQLRWAPSHHISWKRLNDYGYTIERVTIMREGQLVPEPQVLVLNSSPIKPLSLAEWEKMVEENDWAAIAAQALYGENFELTADAPNDIMSFVSVAKEQEQRFSFALFAADQSFEVAKMAGLGFVDKTAKEGEKYVYRIVSNVPKEIDSIKRGNIYIGLEDYTELPIPYDLNAEFSDKAVTLSWEQENFYGIFNSYIVEKSSDGGSTYQSITKKPIINTYNDQKKQSRLAYKLDTLERNDKVYYYRVRGINSFGQISNPSDSVFGRGKSPLSIPPAITSWNAIEDKVQIDWTYPRENNDIIDGFKIEKSATANGPFSIVTSVSNTTRSFLDNSPALTNYYRLTAFAGNTQKSSFPVLVQLEDSIPPVAPSQLGYVISSEGEVYLSWNANKEKDLLGYRIYRSNFQNSEFSEITSEPILTNSFNDAISIKNLTKSIYYQVRAVDLRYNPSEPSETLLVKKPDLVPPVQPIISEIKSDKKGIHLNFIPSSSEDVTKHQIFRKKDTDEEWALIGELNTSENSEFLDTDLIPNQLYYYKIIALDNGGLASEPSNLLSSTYINTINEIVPDNLKASVDPSGNFVKISWENNSNVKHVKIYRAREGETLNLYKNIDGQLSQFRDDNIVLNSLYSYGVQFLFFDKSHSIIETLQVQM